VKVVVALPEHGIEPWTSSYRSVDTSDALYH